MAKLARHMVILIWGSSCMHGADRGDIPELVPERFAGETSVELAIASIAAQEAARQEYYEAKLEGIESLIAFLQSSGHV